MRSEKLEKSNLAIKHADAERRVRDMEGKVVDLEAKIVELQCSKSKEDDYLKKLGQTAENLRHEKNKTKEL